MKPGPRLIGPLWKAADTKTLVHIAADGGPGKTFRVTQATASAIVALCGAATAAGHKLSILSAYRAPEHQAKLFANAVLRYGSEEKARKWVAKNSEHATGQTVDFSLGIANSSANAIAGRFAELPVWKWLSVEAPRQGWTPYTQEPWHWTFNPVT